MSSGFGSLDLNPEGGSPWDDVDQNTNSASNSQTTDSKPDNEPTSPAASTPAPKPTTSTPAKSSIASRSRGPRRAVGHAARFEAVDHDPLAGGPELDSPVTTPLAAEHPPEPPRKEQPGSAGKVLSRANTGRKAGLGDLMDGLNLDDEEEADPEALRKPRVPPPVNPPGPVMNRTIPAHVPVEEAAKVSFDIAVGDPHKVGDLTSAHIVYSVRTKTTSKAYRNPEFQVTRRYSDFLWLYSQLHSNNPGIIVPPPPDKQAVGRFDENFVETRRAALERMLNRIASHPTLQQDADLKIFLESDTFNSDIKHKEKTAPLGTESKGMFSSLGFSSGLAPKFIETDEWFHDRKIHLDTLESSLKSLLKSVDTVIKQRHELASSALDFSTSLHSLSQIELTKSLSSPLAALSDLQLRIKDVHDRQAHQDILTLGITIEEYIRVIASAKLAFANRAKAFTAWHAADAEYSKKKASLEKLQRQGKSQQDRIQMVQAEVGEAERKMHQARLLFEDVGRLLKGELERFDGAKVEDFRAGVETWLESSVEAQKELIEIWETFLYQLDLEEEDERRAAEARERASGKNFPAEATLPLQQQQQQQQQEQIQDSSEPTEQQSGTGETEEFGSPR